MKLVKYPAGDGKYIWFWLDSRDQICSPNFSTEEEAKAWYDAVS